MAWSDRFDDPIILPGGRKLVTFEDAARTIMELPKKQQNLPRWQRAARILIAAAEGRDFPMHVRIAVLQALDLEPQGEPKRKRARK